jgi:hypothetical protein
MTSFNCCIEICSLENDFALIGAFDSLDNSVRLKDTIILILDETTEVQRGDDLIKTTGLFRDGGRT